MANKRQRAIKAAAARELAAKKKGNPEFRQKNPPRQNSPKDWAKNKQQAGYRKGGYEVVGTQKPKEIKVYKELTTV